MESMIAAQNRTVNSNTAQGTRLRSKNVTGLSSVFADLIPKCVYFAYMMYGIKRQILLNLNEQREVQMIDSTIIWAHHQAAGAKGGLKDKILAIQRVASRRKFPPFNDLAKSH